MFQGLRRWFSPRQTPDQQGCESSVTPTAAGRSRDETVVLYARLGPTPASSTPPEQEVVAEEAAEPSHRQTILHQHLAQLGLCSGARCRQLEAIGIVTAEDLVTAELEDLVRRLEAPPAARGVLGSYRRAIRLAMAVPGLTPHEARLLASIHRRTLAALAAESPALLYRDLERFAWSSRGRKQLRGRRLPSPQRVRALVEASANQQAAIGGQQRVVGSGEALEKVA